MLVCLSSQKAKLELSSAMNVFATVLLLLQMLGCFFNVSYAMRRRLMIQVQHHQTAAAVHLRESILRQVMNHIQQNSSPVLERNPAFILRRRPKQDADAARISSSSSTGTSRGTTRRFTKAQQRVFDACSHQNMQTTFDDYSRGARPIDMKTWLLEK
jgi:hypothetical protein